MSTSYLYYSLKPFMPRRLQVFLRRAMVAWKQNKHRATWPINERAGDTPEHWFGWPEGKQFAFILTHDVETARGQERCMDLMNMEKNLGFRSSFNFVPERYTVSPQVLQELRTNGFEIGVHGLLHDGNLYRSEKIFLERAARINHYLSEWEAVGFRSPFMHHNLNWIHHLDIEYDSSTFDTDPFEFQPDGVETIFPFWVNGNCTNDRGYVELPYTLPQDFTIFILMRQKTIDIWKKKLDWIAAKGGMALLNTHPDYMNFQRGKMRNEEYPYTFYEQFLNYVKETYQEKYWHVLAKNVASYRIEKTILKSSLKGHSFDFQAPATAFLKR